jgi:hypothetical protein
MKTKIILAILFFTCTALSEPVNGNQPKNAVSVDVLLPILSPISDEKANWLPIQVKYQRVLGEHLVLMFRYGMFYYWEDKPKEIDFFPMAELDWHPFQKGLKGFYTGGSVFYNYSDYLNSRESETRIALGPSLGWQFVVRRHLIIDLALGLGFGYYNRTDWDGTKNDGFSVDETIGGIFVGWGF